MVDMGRYEKEMLKHGRCVLMSGRRHFLVAVSIDGKNRLIYLFYGMCDGGLIFFKAKGGFMCVKRSVRMRVKWVRDF